MKFAWITAALVCFAGLNSADAGLFSKKNDCGCGYVAATCAAPAPSCAAPAACAPAAAPSCAAPVACAPAAAPSCAAPVAAPSCCAPAAVSCCDPCGKTKKRVSLRDWFGKFKKSKNNCCAPAPSCAAPVACAPTCAAPAAAPSCAVPAASCCH